MNWMEEKAGKSFESIGIGNNFLKRISIVQALRLRINKWDLMKLKIFYKVKDTARRTKW